MKPTYSLLNLNGAVRFIREVEPRLRAEANCFLGLCGGVVRNGHSRKDLDLVLLPLNGKEKPDPQKALAILSEYLGPFDAKDGLNSNGEPRQPYHPLQFNLYRDVHHVDVILVRQK